MRTFRLPPQPPRATAFHALETARRTLPFSKNTGLGFVAECHSTESVNGPCVSHSDGGASGEAALAIMIGPAVCSGCGSAEYALLFLVQLAYFSGFLSSGSPT